MNQLTLFGKNNKLSSDNLKKPALLRDLPFDKIYQSARREASRKKPVFFIHKYFARRITSNFRMILLGLLLPYEEDVWEYFYESHGLDAKDDLVILDPFMGGGTVLFESLRLNAKVIGNDLQPLSKFVSEALVKEAPTGQIISTLDILEKRVGQRIMSYYKTSCPQCNETADVMYNFHVKFVNAETSCAEHYLYQSFVLSSKKGIYTLICPECNVVYESDFTSPAVCPGCSFIISSPKDGYVKMGKFSCPECGEVESLRNFSKSQGYPHSSKIIAQEYHCPHCKTRGYKSATEEDRKLYEKAIHEYKEIGDTLPIPDQKIPDGYNTKQMLNHGYEYFRDLFNPRQLLCLGLLLKEIDNLPKSEAKEWLLLAYSDALEMNNTFCRYQHNAYKISNIFFNHAYVPIAMPVENNVWGATLGTGTFIKTVSKILRGKKFNRNIYDILAVSDSSRSGFKSVQMPSSDKVEATPVKSFDALGRNYPVITCGDSRSLDHIPDNSVDVILTDPPYGSNVMYSELIDFFHVWLAKTKSGENIGFTEPLTPKAEEIVVNNRAGKEFDDYADGLTEVFSECYRVCKDDGYLIFSFHDSSLESWFAVIRALVRSGFSLVQSYPMHSETRTGAHTSNKNSIAFDIFLVCKKDGWKKCHSRRTLNDGSIFAGIEEKALQRTESFVSRLSKVGAELTIRDIENIFVSQFFTEMNELDLINYFDDEKTRSELEFLIDQLDTLFESYGIADMRSGWWAELHRSRWDNK